MTMPTTPTVTPGFPQTTRAVLEEILNERQAQLRKWGQQNHEPSRWLAILAEEFGEAAKAVVEAGATGNRIELENWLQEMRAELIQTAAVATAFVESLDRNELA